MPACTHTGRFISVPLCLDNLNWLLFVFLSNLIINLMSNINTLYNVCAVPWGLLSTVAGVQYRGGYHEYHGDILSTVGCSVPWGIS